MELEIVKKLILSYADVHAKYQAEALRAEKYYKNETDILSEPKKKQERAEKDRNGELVTRDIEQPMRNADNRIPFNFHGLLVNQKASYLFTEPPVFDIGADSSNKALSAFLSDKYSKVCKDLCIEASNKKTGWIHVWKSADDGNYRYAVVPSEQIQPIWSKSLDRKLIGVLRVYHEIDDDGDEFDVYELWNDKECAVYRVLAGGTVKDNLETYPKFFVEINGISEVSNEYSHDLHLIITMCIQTT